MTSRHVIKFILTCPMQGLGGNTDDAKTKGITLVVEEISISLGEERFAGGETGLIITTQLMMFLAKARRWSYLFPNLELS